MQSSLFQNDEAGRAAFIELASKAVQWIANYYQNIESFPVRSQVAPGDIYKQFPASLPASPVSFEEIFQQIDKIIMPGITHWQHPGFYAFFPGNTSFPSIVAEMLTSGIAAQCMIWESSPSAAELEQRCMEWCRDLLGLPGTWSGVIQDTASTATLTALLTAREWKSNFNISTKGFDVTKYRIYASKQAHSSVEKAVRLAGFGTDHLVMINVDQQLSMIVEDLEKQVRSDLSNGFLPTAVISTIGTTATGAVDPVAAVGEICQQYQLWHHIDAAYAGTALMLKEYEYLRQGLEHADSFVFNPHKWMFVQFDCSAYFVRDPGLLVRTMSIKPSYLATMQGETVNDYRDWGIPLGRRFRALKLWMTLHLLGTEAIKTRLAHHLNLAEIVEAEIVKHPLLELAYPRSFNINTFRIEKSLDPEGLHTKKLCLEINDSGKAYMTHAMVEGSSIIRWVCGQTYVQEHHIHDTFKIINQKLPKVLPL